jgi:hypothetical protein
MCLWLVQNVFFENKDGSLYKCRQSHNAHMIPTRVFKSPWPYDLTTYKNIKTHTRDMLVLCLLLVMNMWWFAGLRMTTGYSTGQNLL